MKLKNGVRKSKLFDTIKEAVDWLEQGESVIFMSAKKIGDEENDQGADETGSDDHEDE